MSHNGYGSDRGEADGFGENIRGWYAEERHVMPIASGLRLVAHGSPSKSETLDSVLESVRNIRKTVFI